MGFFDLFKSKKQSRSVEEILGVFSVYQKLLDESKEKCEIGIDSDEFSFGIGKYAFSLDNPIPCYTIPGSYTYLSQLRWNGQPIKYERIGSFGSKVVANSIDGYKIHSSDGQSLGTIYISPYQKKNSSKAPEGFTLVPA